MSPELAYYVVRYYPGLMNETERRAYSHLAGVMKATRGRDDVTAQQEAMRHQHFYHGLSDDPEVLELSKDGMQAFRARTAGRILEDHSHHVLLNYCPRCHELARTPKAKQCRFCGFDWHSAGQGTRED